MCWHVDSCSVVVVAVQKPASATVLEEGVPSQFGLTAKAVSSQLCDKCIKQSRIPMILSLNALEVYLKFKSPVSACYSVVNTSTVEKWRCLPRGRALGCAGTLHALPAPLAVNCWWIWSTSTTMGRSTVEGTMLSSSNLAAQPAMRWNHKTESSFKISLL